MSVTKYLGLIRFSHTVFALPFALAAGMLACASAAAVRAVDFAGILVCMVAARSAAMAFNRLVDRAFDAANPRTASRHLPAGELAVASVWRFTAVSSALFILATGLFLVRDEPNPWPLILSVPVLLVLLGYSYAKRFTALAHFWLGFSLALAPVAAWIAVRGMAEMTVPVVLGGAVFFWVAGFDLLYSTQDAEFDRAAGLKSVPAWLGVRGALRVAAFCHLVTLALLIALGLVTPWLGTVYFGGLVLIALLLAVEHYLVSPDDLSRVNAAFFQVNAFIIFGILLLVAVELAIHADVTSWSARLT